jgi:hypothetical protein
MRIVLALTVTLLIAIPFGALAQDRVVVAGCPVPGAESGCLVLRAADGKLYDLAGARQRPPLNGRGIRITGTRASRFSYCQQGEALAEVTWETTGTLCPGR